MAPVIRNKGTRSVQTMAQQSTISPFDMGAAFVQLAQFSERVEQLIADFNLRLHDAHTDTDKTRKQIVSEMRRKFEADLDALLKTISDETRTQLSGSLKYLNDTISEAKKTAEHIKKIKAKDGEDGKDGKTPILGVDYFTEVDKKSIAEKVLSYIVPPQNGKDGVTPDTNVIVNMVIEALKESKLTVDHIKGLNTKFAEVRSAAALSGGAHGGQGSWKLKSLSGTIDGSNKVFTAPGEKPAENSHHLVLNYQEQNPLTDYTVTWAAGLITITYTTAPDVSLSGQPHYLRYM